MRYNYSCERGPRGAVLIETDFLVVGAGIIGLCVARELSGRFPDARIVVAEKEPEVALHASGRNSGVLHAGFYYSPETLKARFAADGNRMLSDYCLEHGLSINRCGKVVVARNEEELAVLHALRDRAEAQKIEAVLVDEKTLAELEPNAKTFGAALHSPTTSSVDPREVCRHIFRSLEPRVRFLFGCPFLAARGRQAVTGRGTIRFRHVVNCGGLYADRIAHAFGMGNDYTILPFKGLYLHYRDNTLLRMHVYPVPDLRYPFLGVHFTKTVDGMVKIGPTAIPALWREQYRGWGHFRADEFFAILSLEGRLFLGNAFGFRDLALRELANYRRSTFISEAAALVRMIDRREFGSYHAAGIRAQLLDRTTGRLVMDFVIETSEGQTHVLNAVSPAFTCAFPVARHVCDTMQGTDGGAPAVH